MNNSNNIFTPVEKKTAQSTANQLLFSDPWPMVRQWYSGELGQTLLQSEQSQLAKFLEQIFGYNLLQLGCLDADELIKQARTSYQYIFSSSQHRHECASHSISLFAQLAVQNQSIDAVILPHTLEFEANPHQILREVERILLAEGKLIILGFNPFSLWGLWHKYWEIRQRVFSTSKTRADKNYSKTDNLPLPSYGRLISQKRLSDWLQLLGFDVEQVCEHFYRPPINRSGLLKKLQFMEQAGPFSRVLPAGAYVLLATKRVSTLTPIKPKWKFPKAIMGAKVTQTARFNTDKEQQ